MISIDKNGNWREYCANLPAGAEALGVVSVPKTSAAEGLHERALIRLSSGRYVMMRDGLITKHIDGRTIAGLLGKSGRPKMHESAKRVTVTLDAESLALAQELGGGNVSEGVRKALGNFESYAAQFSAQYPDGSGFSDS